MKIVYEDDYIAVCRKDAGELSEGETDGCLPYMIARYLEGKGHKSPDVFTVHRLDRETEGLMVYALTSESAAALSEDIREGRFLKEYIAVCHGVLDEPGATLTDLLYYDRRRGKSFVVDRKRAGVKQASLEYEVLSVSDGFSRLKIRLHTGRTHQIRVQLASRRHPLAGDRRYGAPKDGYKNIALLSYRLVFAHPKTGERMEFVADGNNDNK
ncbi:MAG: RluA family pseudouridine synthase [Clostridia bacterium]|nr:RluA family pseudouridine synthase [Clostridia bacterium]